MSSTRKTQPKAPKTSADYRHKVHRFYAEPWIAEGLKNLAAVNEKAGRRDDTLSALVIAGAKKLLRANAARLRAGGVELPEELFSK